MFTKTRKGRIRGVTVYNETLVIKKYGLVTLQPGRLRTNQIEATRRVISKASKKLGRYLIHVQANTAVSKKPSEVRMGKGKGGIDHYISRVRAGQLLFTVEGLSPTISQNTLLKASRKLPIKTKIINN